MENEMYTLSEIVQELLKSYKTVRPNDEANLRKKIEKLCRTIMVDERHNLWEYSARDSKNEKKPRHFFTASERKGILLSSEIRSYVLKHISTEEYKKFMEAKKKADELNKQAMEYEEYKQSQEEATWPEELTQAEYDYAKRLESYMDSTPTPFWSDDIGKVNADDVKKKKLEMMLEALYLKFFEPIDEDALLRDMSDAIIPGDLLHTAESVIARDRLKAGAAYYCKEKQKPEGKKEDKQ